jgi:hypothetical protein
LLDGLPDWPYRRQVRRLRLIACATGLAVLAIAAPPAAADFDPPDGTVIYTNLPASVPFAYQIDIGALCGTQQPASITAKLRTPAGVELEPAYTPAASGQHEQVFGIDLFEEGLYEHSILVRCADDTMHVVEQGTFTIVAGEPEPTPPSDDPAATPPQQRSPEPPASSSCGRAVGALERAHAKLRKAKRALRGRRSAKRRKAVRSAKQSYRAAKQRKAARCAK